MCLSCRQVGQHRLSAAPAALHHAQRRFDIRPGTQGRDLLPISIGIAVPLFVLFPAGLWALPCLLGAAAGASLLNARFGTGKELRLMNEMGSAQRSMSNHFIFTTAADTRRGKDIRLYGAQKLIRERVEAEWPRYRKWFWRFSRAGMAEGACSGVPEGLLQGGAYLCAVLGALSGALSAGAVLRFGAALYSLAQDCVRLANLLSEMLATARRQQSTYDYLNVPNALYRGTLAVEKRFDNDFEIAFQNVSFRYPGAQDYALKDLNLTLRVGERMAVVGKNGSGKTTMIKLLCRLYVFPCGMCIYSKKCPCRTFLPFSLCSKGF